MFGVGAGEGAVWYGGGCSGESEGGGDEEDVFELHCGELDVDGAVGVWE